MTTSITTWSEQCFLQVVLPPLFAVFGGQSYITICVDHADADQH